MAATLKLYLRKFGKEFQRVAFGKNPDAKLPSQQVDAVALRAWRQDEASLAESSGKLAGEAWAHVVRQQSGQASGGSVAEALMDRHEGEDEDSPRKSGSSGSAARNGVKADKVFGKQVPWGGSVETATYKGHKAYKVKPGGSGAPKFYSVQSVESELQRQGGGRRCRRVMVSFGMVQQTDACTSHASGCVEHSRVEGFRIANHRINADGSVGSSWTTKGAGKRQQGDDDDDGDEDEDDKPSPKKRPRSGGAPPSGKPGPKKQRDDDDEEPDGGASPSPKKQPAKKVSFGTGGKDKAKDKGQPAAGSKKSVKKAGSKTRLSLVLSSVLGRLLQRRRSRARPAKARRKSAMYARSVRGVVDAAPVASLPLGQNGGAVSTSAMSGLAWLSGQGTTTVQLSGQAWSGKYQVGASRLVDRVGDRPWALVKADEMGQALGRAPVSAWEPPSSFVWTCTFPLTAVDDVVALLQGKYGMVPEYVLGMHYTPALQRELAAEGKVGMNVCTSAQWDTRLPSFRGDLQDVLHLKQWEGGVFSPNCHPLTFASGEHAAAKLLDGRMFFGASEFAYCLAAPVAVNITETADGYVPAILGVQPCVRLRPSTLGDDFGKTLCLYTRNATPIVLTDPGAQAGSQDWHDLRTHDLEQLSEFRAAWTHMPKSSKAIVQALLRPTGAMIDAPRHSDLVEVAAARMWHVGAPVPEGYNRADARPRLTEDREYVRSGRGAGDPDRYVKGVVPRLVAAQREPSLRGTNDQLWERLGYAATPEAGKALRVAEPRFMHLAAKSRRMFESRLAAAREKLREVLGGESTDERAGGRDLGRSYGTPPRKAAAARRLSSEVTELVRADVDADDQGAEGEKSRPKAVRGGPDGETPPPPPPPLRCGLAGAAMTRCAPWWVCELDNLPLWARADTVHPAWRDCGHPETAPMGVGLAGRTRPGL